MRVTLTLRAGGMTVLSRTIDVHDLAALGGMVGQEAHRLYSEAGRKGFVLDTTLTVTEGEAEQAGDLAKRAARIVAAGQRGQARRRR